MVLLFTALFTAVLEVFARLLEPARAIGEVKPEDLEMPAAAALPVAPLRTGDVYPFLVFAVVPPS